MHFEIKGKDFPSIKYISTDKGVAEIKSYYPRFAYVKESSKASHIRKYLKAGFSKTILKNIFGKYFLSFENSLLGYSESPQRPMLISMFLKANVQRLGSYQKL